MLFICGVFSFPSSLHYHHHQLTMTADWMHIKETFWLLIKIYGGLVAEAQSG